MLTPKTPAASALQAARSQSSRPSRGVSRLHWQAHTSTLGPRGGVFGLGRPGAEGSR